MDVSRIIQDHEWITVLISEVISVVIVECIRLSAHIFFRPSFKTINSIDQFKLAASEVFFVPVMHDATMSTRLSCGLNAGHGGRVQTLPVTSSVVRYRALAHCKEAGAVSTS
jgi:hypothetical protein